MNETFVIGIAGGTASGKSTFSEALYEAFQNEIVYLKCDDYYRSNDEMTEDERRRVNYDAPESIEFELLIAHI